MERLGNVSDSMMANLEVAVESVEERVGKLRNNRPGAMRVVMNSMSELQSLNSEFQTIMNSHYGVLKKFTDEIK